MQYKNEGKDILVYRQGVFRCQEGGLDIDCSIFQLNKCGYNYR